tara:strand:+ start:1813 stop:2565 length:753 start_codon:yes stop_codon:yes gene_type:complete
LINPDNTIPIILAAGMGTRLGSSYSNIPKSFINIGEKKIIEIQFEILIKAGFKRIIIVNGFLNELFVKEIGNAYKNLSIEYVTNEKFNSTGSAYSLMLTFEIWTQNKNNVLLLHADLLYDEKVLLDFCKISNPKKNYILLDSNFSEETNDEQIVIGKDKKVLELIKSMPLNDNQIGESLGINLWTKGFMEQYYKFLENYLENNPRSNWEQTIKPFLCLNKNVELLYEDINNRFWVNINYIEDLDKSKKLY